MSRVLKSSQVILDKDKFKLPPMSHPRVPDIKQEASKNEKIDLENAEALISQKMKEIDELYERTLETAGQEADNIISEAYEKSKEIMDQARKEGFFQGQSEGFEEGKKQADSIIQEALMVKRKVESDSKTMIVNFEKEVVALVVSTIEKILNKKIDEEHDVIENLIHAGLEKCAYTEELVLRVSLDDYDFALSIKDKILVLSQNVSDITIRQDKSLSKGSCILDSSAGSIDSSIWTQFNQVKEMFEELLRIEWWVYGPFQQIFQRCR